MTGIYLTVHRYWILASSQSSECWNFFRNSAFLFFSTPKVNVFICTDVSSCIIQYLLQPTRLIVIRFLSIACHKYGIVLHQDTNFPPVIRFKSLDDIPRTRVSFSCPISTEISQKRFPRICITLLCWYKFSTQENTELSQGNLSKQQLDFISDLTKCKIHDYVTVTRHKFYAYRKQSFSPC